ncbi:MAG: phenylalanine--tRNA ligase subunit beta, partial [Oscillospiraceae bacterium]|nr:phenylalanine--tRNA ligase subunit beta [Oscillospiraceae bacterium]
MRVSMDWIRDFVDLGGHDVGWLAERLTLSTAEVDGIHLMGEGASGVVAGRVVSCEPIRAAGGDGDRPVASLLRLDVGGARTLTSVCGAPNAAVGITVPVALPGGKVGGLGAVRGAMVHGHYSEAVVCSEAELGIGDDHGGVMILDASFGPGSDVLGPLGVKDQILEIDNKSLTNRPDLWGHYGLAREFAAILGVPLSPIGLAAPEPWDAAGGLRGGPGTLDNLEVKVEDPEKCHRYCGVTVAGARSLRTPPRMRARLHRCGVRPISAAVDLTNYVMLEMGQPMHAFDRSGLRGPVTVRSFPGPLPFKTLDGALRQVPAGALLICDGADPIALAGIMGGERTEVGADTDTLFLESANFSAHAIRKASMAMGLRTEASARFEKALDPRLAEDALRRFAHLAAGFGGGLTFSALADEYVRRPPQVVVDVPARFISARLGKEMGVGEVAGILRSLSFTVEELACQAGPAEEAVDLRPAGQAGPAVDAVGASDAGAGPILRVTVPSFRATKDVTIKEDIVEEVSRIHGYGNVPPKAPSLPLAPLRANRQSSLEDGLRDLLALGFGASEVHSYLWHDDAFDAEAGFMAGSDVTVVNQASSGCGRLRGTMALSMLSFAALNDRHLGDYAIYEIGGVVHRADGGAEGTFSRNLCVLSSAKEGGHEAAFLSMKGIAERVVSHACNRRVRVEPFDAAKAAMSADGLRDGYGNQRAGFLCGKAFAGEAGAAWIHPRMGAYVSCGDVALGYLTVLHPAVAQRVAKNRRTAILELSVEALCSLGRVPAVYAPLPKFPEVSLDFNFLVDEKVPFAEVWDHATGCGDSAVRGVSFVSLYAGKGLPVGRKSLTFGVRAGLADRTLSGD